MSSGPTNRLVRRWWPGSPPAPPCHSTTAPPPRHPATATPPRHPATATPPHYPALDGMRGIAVLAVLLYHGGVAWAPGGFLGVEGFFVLSGFLITSLLVAEWQRSAKIALGAFWARRARRLLPALFCLVAVLDTALIFDGGRNLDRVYYGTDTRAASLLIGASLAIAMAMVVRRPQTADVAAPPRRRRLPAAATARTAAATGAAVALGAVPAAVAVVSGTTAWMYPYGLLGLDGLVILLIVAAVKLPSCTAARVLAARPLRALGQISYGVYLWHFPLFLWLTAGATGVSGAPLLGVRLAVTFAVSIASYVLIEQPIRQRRRPARLIRALTPVAAGGAVASLLVAAAAGAAPAGVPAADTLPQPPPQLRGSDPACTITLNDARAYGVAPVPGGKDTQFEYASLGAHQLTWSGSARKTFQTCPPKRVLLVGDSLAFTLGLPWLGDEERYGVQLADAAILGCAFTTEGELEVAGTWEGQSAGCPGALEQWAREERALRAQAVIVELGYRDQFDWRIAGKVVHLGQPAFDAYVQHQINRLVATLGAGGTKILFLSIPYAHPPDLPNGSPAPAASPDRRALINSMLEAAARRDPSTVRVLDIDRTVSPGSHYNADVNGQLCRFDGVHFSVYCSKLLEPSVLGEVRKMLG